jgi:23S rRNA maturation mini-RNase III
MATYYKYAERAAGSQVNWAEIGKNLTDTLQEENKLREQKKAAIDEATRQYGLELEKSPQGENVTFNQWGLDYAGDAQEARLLQDRLLKQGKLKLKDYTIMRQNLTDGTKQAFNLLDEYNAEYKEKMARSKSMDPATRGQYLEQWLMSKGEMFANLKDSKLYINPTTFAVSVAKIKDENGVRTMSNNPNDFTTINELRNYIKSKYDYFDSDTYLTKQVGMLGTSIKASIISGSSYKVGQKITIEDITEKDGAKDAISAMINTAFAGMPTNMSSVLTNDLGADSDGNKFDFTFNKDEMGKIVDGKNLIYFDPNGEPQFTKEQEKAAKDFMLQKMSAMLTRKEDIDVYTEPRPAASTSSNKPTEGQSKSAGLGNLIGYLYSGDQGQIDSAIDALKNMEGVEDVQRFRDRVEIKFDGDSEYRPFKFGSTIQDFVRSFGYALDPTSDLNAMVAGAYNIGNPVLNQDYETGIDFIGQFPNGYDPNNYLDQLKMNTLKAEYEQRKKEYNSRARQNSGSGQQGGGTGELD